MKKILVTAGPVYGKVDDNKILSNRARGIWATRFACEMAIKGHDVTLLVADIKHGEAWDYVANKTDASLRIDIHNGFHDYQEKCLRYAKEIDVAVMSAAVLNYIPVETYKGKLPTDDEFIDLKLQLAPKVINGMKLVNPKMTLIGCKLLFSGDEETLIDAAYKVVLNARCNMVIANDGVLGLKDKYLVHQDRTVIKLNNDFDELYRQIEDHIFDEHWKTIVHNDEVPRDVKADKIFLSVCERYRKRFNRRQSGKDFVFGSVAVRAKLDLLNRYLISPREKGEMFTHHDAVMCSFDWRHREVWTHEGKKATLNAPLLARHLEKYPDAVAVVHYHDPTGDLTPIGYRENTVAPARYAPPGTRRDNEREIPSSCYWIEGHGWIVALNDNLEPI